MRQPEDTKTLEIFTDEKRGRGRPRIANPMTPAQRQAKRRGKLSQIGKCTHTFTMRELVALGRILKKDGSEEALLLLSKFKYLK